MISTYTVVIFTLGLFLSAISFMVWRIIKGRRAVVEVAIAIGLQKIQHHPVWEGTFGKRLVRIGWVEVPEDRAVGVDSVGLGSAFFHILGAFFESYGSSSRPFHHIDVSYGNRKRTQKQTQLIIEVNCKNPRCVQFEHSGAGHSFEGNLGELPSKATVELLELKLGRLEAFMIAGQSVSFRMDDRYQLYITSEWLKQWLDRCLEYAAFVEGVKLDT